MIVTINGIGSILDHLVHSEAVIVGQPRCRNIHFIISHFIHSSHLKSVQSSVLQCAGVAPLHVMSHGVDHQTSGVGQLPGHRGDYTHDIYSTVQ